jgi:starch-binding outer membrane protein, SusD/RagB family
MKSYKNKVLTLIICVGIISGCTKLNEGLNQSFPFSSSGGGGGNAAGILVQCYQDLGTPFTAQDHIFSLEENATDESLVPTRGGDWDDNGAWRVLHAHTWDATHTQPPAVFVNLGQLESDATTVLALNPTAEQAAEATFLRSFAQYYFLELFGQVPYRTVPNYNTVGAAPVMQPAACIDTLVANLTQIIPLLPSTNNAYQANPDAARFLLMKVLLNKQAFLNPAAPAAAVAADMQEVYTLGQAIVASGMANPGGTLGLTTNYFDNFGPNNGGFGGAGTSIGGPSTEEIFALDNNGTATNPNGTTNAGIDAEWMMGLHYNSWDQQAPNAGWNGFSTVSEVYNAFDATDTRKGNVPYPAPNAAGVSPISGLNVGMDEGQQYNETGTPIKDRKGNLLNFAPTVSLIESNVATLEGDGIRVMKYYPDYAAYNGGNASNQLVLFRYADVLLMMAEADLRGASGGSGDALTIVNTLHATRGAQPLAAISLVNTSNLYDGTTLLEERQKELYWERWRREDLIRFGAFLLPWDLKPTDNPKYLLYAIPTTQLIVNPNLHQNPGY